MEEPGAHCISQFSLSSKLTSTQFLVRLPSPYRIHIDDHKWYSNIGVCIKSPGKLGKNMEDHALPLFCASVFLISSPGDSDNPQHLWTTGIGNGVAADMAEIYPLAPATSGVESSRVRSNGLRATTLTSAPGLLQCQRQWWEWMSVGWCMTHRGYTPMNQYSLDILR